MEENATMQVVHVFSDTNGVTHIADKQIPLFEPAAARLTHLTKVRSIAFRILPIGFFNNWHTIPGRRYIIILSGMVEVGAADGQVRQTGPGCVTLHEDIEGKGHTTRVVGDSPAIVAFISLEDDK